MRDTKNRTREPLTFAIGKSGPPSRTGDPQMPVADEGCAKAVGNFGWASGLLTQWRPGPS